MTTIARVLCAATRRLRAAGIEGARAEARLLLRHVTGLPPEVLVADRDRSLEAEALGRFEALVARRAAREPMAYVLGEREFWSLPLTVGPGVLVPRPETETLVEAALEAFPDRTVPLRILDLGTGSGCLLVALLREYPNAVGVGVDRSAEALGLAADNARRHGLAGRALLVRGDWGRALAGPFELIVANPPYVASSELADLAPEVARHEPRAALDGGPDGLDAYRAILPDLGRLLGPGGVACLEIGAGQAAVLSVLAEAADFRVAVRPDLAGIPRCLLLRHRTP
ncbi:MAG: peptide chain release factor N(5)-glutamine methyltransferase [Geminicoccaceae bacterium]|nr:peptide chain release factor N(5)-glutamine methyltransferase [Geminicoccaceae bacterium]